ncbi:cell division protein FtsK, partial [Streptomyces sp. SID12501]|nr:cell division protein FtsK [Streptomyces sp. SID12501]
EDDEDAPLLIEALHSARPEPPAKKRRSLLGRRRADDVPDPDDRRLDEYEGDEAFERAAQVHHEDLDDVDDVPDVVETRRMPPAAPTAPTAVVTPELTAPAPTGVPRGEQPMLEGDVVYLLPHEDALAKGAPHKV